MYLHTYVSERMQCLTPCGASLLLQDVKSHFHHRKQVHDVILSTRSVYDATLLLYKDHYAQGCRQAQPLKV